MPHAEGVESKFYQLQELLRELGSALSAFSGGVDGALLSTIALPILLDRLMAATAQSILTSARDLEDARFLAGRLNTHLLVVRCNELEIPGFADNTIERCYICKKYRHAILLRLAEAYHLRWVMDGSNADDLCDFRPGIFANAR